MRDPISARWPRFRRVEHTRFTTAVGRRGARLDCAFGGVHGGWWRRLEAPAFSVHGPRTAGSRINPLGRQRAACEAAQGGSHPFQHRLQSRVAGSVVPLPKILAEVKELFATL